MAQLEYRYDSLSSMNFEFLHAGYLQGMNDLLVPITILMSTKHISFWCFSGFQPFLLFLFISLICRTDRKYATIVWQASRYGARTDEESPDLFRGTFSIWSCNFRSLDRKSILSFMPIWEESMEQTSSSASVGFCCTSNENLYIMMYVSNVFCFCAWLIIQIYTIWEAIWTTSFPEKDYVAMIAVSIILKHRDYILENKLVHDDILRVCTLLCILVSDSHAQYMNSISGKLSAEEVLEFTNSLYTKFIVQNFTYPQKKTSIFGSNDQRILFI